MELVYKFSEDERRVIGASLERHLAVLRVIAELHRLDGAVALAADTSGFVMMERADDGKRS